MRLFELVDSDEQLLGLIKPILLRAKAEGATSVDMSQLINDLDTEDNITPEVMVDVLNKNRSKLKNILSSATVDAVELDTGVKKAMTTKSDQDAEKIKATALKKAQDLLKQ